MLNQIYLDIARMRYEDLLEESERDRKYNEAFRMSRDHAPVRRQVRPKLAWLSRWNLRAIRNALAARG
jgi:hypothetical protein